MKLYIGNIPYETTEVELREALGAFEPFEDFYYPLDRDTGRPRGFAFVTVGSRELGERAIEELNGVEVGGREMRVREAEERRERSGGGGGGGYKGGGGGGGYKGGGGGGGGYRGGGGGDRRGGGGGRGRDERRGKGGHRDRWD